MINGEEKHFDNNIITRSKGYVIQIPQFLDFLVFPYTIFYDYIITDIHYYEKNVTA